MLQWADLANRWHHLRIPCNLIWPWRKAAINALNKWKSTPLHWAACRGNISTGKLLLLYKADRNLKNSNGRTPLGMVSHKMSQITSLYFYIFHEKIFIFFMKKCNGICILVPFWNQISNFEAKSTSKMIDKFWKNGN